MAPIDRNEHRQQRMRGAGVANVATNFSFNLGGLSLAGPKKQPALPPQRSGRRTPVRTTPPGPTASAQRQRSASVQRSNAKRRSTTPRQDLATPRSGKRKRGSKDAPVVPSDEEADELSPDRPGQDAPTVEKIRKVAPISPIREEVDDEPDELSFVGHVMSSVLKHGAAPQVAQTTPVSASENARLIGAATSESTPIAGSTKSTTRSPSQNTRSARKIMSAEPGPGTPAGPTVLPRLKLTTPGLQQHQEESEDELSPPQLMNVPFRGKNKTPLRVAERVEKVDELPPTLDELPPTLDELPPTLDELPPTPNEEPVPEPEPSMEMEKAENDPTLVKGPAPAKSRKRGRPRRVVEEEIVETTPEVSLSASPKEPSGDALAVSADAEIENSALSTTATENRPSPIKHPERSRRTRLERARSTEEEEERVAVTAPALQKSRGVNGKALEIREDNVEAEQQQVPEKLSREKERIRGKRQRSQPALTNAQPIPSIEESDGYQDADEEEDAFEPRSRPTSTPRARSTPMDTSRPKPTGDKPPRKRQKRGPTEAIQVWGLKGFGGKALTVVDKTRSVLEDFTVERINRIAAKMKNTNDKLRRKKLRQQLNVFLAYKEEVDLKMLDIGDPHHTLAENMGKLKQHNKDIKSLRNKYLQVQRDRDQIALENDQVLGAYEHEKRETEKQNELSQSLYDIQAAIQNGKDRARAEGLEDEGPDVPLKMLLDNVATDIGPTGGLLARVKNFNSVLDRAAGFLERRAS